MSKFLHDADAAKAIAIPRVFSENSRAEKSIVHTRSISSASFQVLAELTSTLLCVLCKIRFLTTSVKSSVNINNMSIHLSQTTKFWTLPN